MSGYRDNLLRKMEQINKDIEAGTFSPYYLLCGDEDYLKSQALSKLQKAILKDGIDMNYTCFEGKKFKLEEFISFGQTLPFFAEYRLVVLKDTGFFSENCDSFIEALNSIAPTTIVIFVESDNDKRNRLYKLVNAKGYVSELKTPDEKQLLTWLKSKFIEEKKRISDADIMYFLECVGKDMNLLKNEMEKLCCYLADKEVITRKDMDEVMIFQVEGKMFDMLTAIGKRNKHKALELYHDLIAVKEPVKKLFIMLERQFNLILEIKSAKEKGVSNDEIAKKAGIRPFLVGKTMEQAKQFEKAELIAILEECAEMDKKIKSGMIKDQIALELLIVSFSSK